MFNEKFLVCDAVLIAPLSKLIKFLLEGVSWTFKEVSKSLEMQSTISMAMYKSLLPSSS